MRRPVTAIAFAAPDAIMNALSDCCLLFPPSPNHRLQTLIGQPPSFPPSPLPPSGMMTPEGRYTMNGQHLKLRAPTVLFPAKNS